MAAIETSGLTKRYGDVVAVDGIDLTVEEGEVFGFLGPNGAGKTTTIDMLLDFIRPTEGSATVLGYDAQSETDAVRQRVGILPDGVGLYDRSTGYRHLEFAIESKGGSETPDELLDRVGLDREAAERPVGGYSKGMTQRLTMAMALAGDPDLLVLDEPSSGLDPIGIREMQQLVREEAESGTTVFFSSHILGQVSAVCDRVGILDEGELVTVDTIEGLREEAGVGSRLVVEVGGGGRAENIDLTALSGVTAVDREDGNLVVSYTDAAAKAAAIHRLVDAGVEVLDFSTEEATLEDLFAAYTGTDAAAVQDADAEAGEESGGTGKESGEAGEESGEASGEGSTGRVAAGIRGGGE
ncbi:ABC transporter ATP-binding protein [Natronoarchaeum rubrum]|uniref:ABC transporter ATP-binding protein n=1 Tax=Natronoarchaeum rubrum TaxID=755311 RepID=UPI0021110B92|nr:ABC transporter ATP-binding protein [Natronoarchaeum rubrum]